MIQNEHQYEVTQNQLKVLEQALNELFKIQDNLHPRQFSSRQKGLQLTIDSLRKEIEEYDQSKKQQIAQVASE